MRETRDRNGRVLEPGDSVKHEPSGEEWWLVWTDEEHVIPAGWPFPSRGLSSDCVLLAKGTHEEREHAVAAYLRALGGDRE